MPDSHGKYKGWATSLAFGGDILTAILLAKHDRLDECTAEGPNPIADKNRLK
jgi:hypothetical protein